MSTFVLVHGAWHGAWCWFKVVPRLKARGHDVVTFDLPAHGIDDARPDAGTLGAYVDRTCQVVDDQAEPVVLVGHSLGGAVITQVAEERPDAIETLVYLSAFLLDDGESLADHRAPGSALHGNRVVDDEHGTIRVDDGAIEEAFYHDCSAADVTLCRSLMREEPVSPMSAPVDTTPDRFGRVRRAYVECTRDQALPPAVQRSMREALPCDPVHRIDSSHSPFLSMPEELVDRLHDIARAAQ